MKKWQRILKEHHDIEIINDTAAIVRNVIFDTINNIILNDIIKRIDNGYLDRDNNYYESIYDYLGY